MAKLNHISIVISTRNSELYVNKCIDSVLSQLYPDFEVIFIDACSTDKTYFMAKEYEKKYNNIRVIQNDIRKFQGDNLLSGVKLSPNNSIVISMDGDDWFKDELVLHRINFEYLKTDCWMTYGSYEEYPFADVSHVYHEYPFEVRKEKLFRFHRWMGTHLRTFRKELFLKINVEDLKDPSTGDFFSYAPDLSFQFPMLEMCGTDKSRFISSILYVYNRENENSESVKGQKEIDRIEKIIRAKTPYKTINEL